MPCINKLLSYAQVTAFLKTKLTGLAKHKSSADAWSPEGTTLKKGGTRSDDLKYTKLTRLAMLLIAISDTCSKYIPMLKSKWSEI